MQKKKWSSAEKEREQCAQKTNNSHQEGGKTRSKEKKRKIGCFGANSK